jgi:hypothetical protein
LSTQDGVGAGDPGCASAAKRRGVNCVNVTAAPATVVVFKNCLRVKCDVVMGQCRLMT